MASISGTRHTRGGVFRGPVVDGLPSLLVGNVGLAAHNEANGTNDGYAGPDCATIPIIANVPDAAALAGVEADPNCFTLFSRFPGGFTPQFGGNMTDSSLVTGLRGFTSTGLNWDASVNIGSTEVDQFIFDTVNASLGYDTPTSFSPGIYAQKDINLNFDISMPVHEHHELRGGHGVAPRAVHDRGGAASRRGRSARTRRRASAPDRTALTATGPTRRREPGTAATSPSTATSSSTTRAAGGRSAPRSASRTSVTSARRRTGSCPRASA